MSIPDNERVEDPCEYMAQLAQTYLPLNHWGFKESYRSKEDERLIFNSQRCRIKFIWSGWEMYGGNTISIYYGRLHAPSDNVRMNWNEEVCPAGIVKNSRFIFLINGQRIMLQK